MTDDRKSNSAVWRRLLRIADWADAPALFLGKAAAWLILPLILIILVDAVGRKFLRKLDFVVENGLHEYLNSPVLQDAEWHMHAMIFLCAFGYAYCRNAHVRLDILRPRLGAQGRMWVELLGGLFLLGPFLGVFCYYAWDFFLSAWLSDETSGMANGIDHRWFIKFFVFLGPVLLALAVAAMLLRLAARLFGPPDLADATRTQAITDGKFSAFE